MHKSAISTVAHTGKIAVAGLSFALLAGCGIGGQENLSDRPFVMACTGQNLFSANYVGPHGPHPTHLAGVRIPDYSELHQLSMRSGRIGGAAGYTREIAAIEGHVATLPVAVNPGAMMYGDTGEIMLHESSLGRPAYHYRPYGEVRVEHYYLSGDGELHEVDDFHVARMVEGRTIYGHHRPLIREVAATLPADAAYAVYRIEAKTEQARIAGSDRKAMEGRPGYWVFPLSDSHRYQPYDASAERGEYRERPLGPYVGSASLRVHGDEDRRRWRNGHPPATAWHRRADRGVETAPCFMQLGSTITFAELYDTKAGASEDGYHEPLSGEGLWRAAEGNSYGLYFVGDRDALMALPSSPDSFISG